MSSVGCDWQVAGLIVVDFAVDVMCHHVDSMCSLVQRRLLNMVHGCWVHWHVGVAVIVGEHKVLVVGQ